MALSLKKVQAQINIEKQLPEILRTSCLSTLNMEPKFRRL
uniref:Uncharacterized protein n=1 Tax=Manihot esculenta TaxID=3983 RepID=A0A2C9WIN3_MANES